MKRLIKRFDIKYGDSCWVTTLNGNTNTCRRPDIYTRNLIPNICIIVDIYQDKYYGVVS